MPKSIVDILLSKNPQQDDQEVDLVYTLLKFFLLSHSLPVLQNILGQEYFWILFHTVCVVLLVFTPGQDQHNMDSFHRNYVKQFKKKLPLEHFLIVSQSYVSRTPSELLIDQRHIQLGYDLNEACC